MKENQGNLEGWAVVELFGHQKEVGYVTTQHFGGASMFQIDVPSRPERELTLDAPQWHKSENRLLPAGSVIRLAAVPGRSRLIGVGAVYAINPCDEATALAVAETKARRQIQVVSLAAQAALPPEVYEDDEGSDDES